MNEDTPLTEVAHHLPAETAAYLMDLSTTTQNAVLKSVRSFVAALEERTTLDPFQYEVVVDVFAVTISAHFEAMGGMMRHLINPRADLPSEEGS